METNPSMLKSSMFGGFKKKEVLSYIFELNESTQEAQQKFAEQIEELDRSRQDLIENVAELEARLASVQASLDDTSARLGRESARNAEISELLERLKAEAVKRDKDISEKESELLRITSKYSELQNKNRQLEEKREQVELAAAQIAGLLKEAQADADKVVEDARQQASVITDEAKKQANSITDAAKASAASYIDNANSTITGVYKQFGSFRKELGSLGKTIADACAEITSRVDVLSEATANVKDSVPETLELNESFLLSYETVEEAAKPAESVPAKPVETSAFAKEVLGRYGVRKDDSGFFRLAAEKKQQ